MELPIPCSQQNFSLEDFVHLKIAKSAFKKMYKIEFLAFGLLLCIGCIYGGGRGRLYICINNTERK